jgi:SNF2-related domain/SNF2 Helicase protein/Helicase conserved C-terminal domain
MLARSRLRLRRFMLAGMSHGLSLSPAGRLVYQGEPEPTAAVPPVLSPRDAEQVAAAFATSSAAGLIELARQRQAGALGPVGEFWRGFARRLFTALCGLGEASPEQWKRILPPAEEELAELVASAPPMRGLEYLTAAVLRNLWNELAAEIAARAADWKGGPAAFLADVDPLFHQLGRVTFHLAENKRDPARPFAFLATYTHRVSERAKVAHLPLAEAVKTYAGARDAAKLKALLAPVERAADSIPLVRELLDRKALFAPQAWSIRQAYRFLQEAQRMEEAGIVVRLPDWWSARRPPRPQVQVRLGQREPSGLGLEGMLDFDVALTLDGDELTDAERQSLLAATDGLALLRGKWVEVDRERLQQALDHWKEIEQAQAQGVDFIQGMRLLSGAALEEAEDEGTQAVAWSSVVAGEWLRGALAQLRAPEPDRACQPGRDLQATLRPYQVEGVRWLWLITQLGLGGCLADDMGLGKTIQVIDLLLQRRRAAGKQRQPPTLLIVPASLLGNWRQELTRFAPTLNVQMLHRSECAAEVLDRIAAAPDRELTDCDLVVTTYGLVRRQPWLAGASWSLIVLDEAQAIKNAGSNQTKSVKALAARSRLALTGTPVENQLGDLWSLFDFACPGLLGNAAEFKRYVKRLNADGGPQAYASLRRLVRPYILRRLKTDPAIVPDLPLKTELRTECGLSRKQAALYEKAVADLAQRLKTADGMARRGLVLATLMQLKQICNHPSQHLQRPEFSPGDSGKFERLRLLCEPILERQERALVFTQFQSLTEPLAAFLATIFGRPGLVLHGGTPVKRRSELVRTFQAAEGPPFFVISLKAGGSGLNLTAASHVIHFDRWWNPAVENQATDRAFRIGQVRNVLVHKFVCRGTVEERIDDLIGKKQAIADQILGPDEGAATNLTEMSDDELLGFVSLDLRRSLADD